MFAAFNQSMAKTSLTVSYLLNVEDGLGVWCGKGVGLTVLKSPDLATVA